MQGDDFLCLVFPGGEIGELVVVDSFDDFANHGLLVEVVLLGLFQSFEMLLVAAVYGGRGCLEACPYLVAQLFGYRTRIAEFLVQLLQLVKGGNYIRFVGQLFGGFAKVGLYFEVFLEVVFTEFVVQFQ